MTSKAVEQQKARAARMAENAERRAGVELDDAAAPVTEVRLLAAETPKPVRVSLDLAPALYDDFGDWCKRSARELGRGRVKNVDVLRSLVRELLDDPDLQGRVRDRLRLMSK